MTSATGVEAPDAPREAMQTGETDGGDSELVVDARPAPPQGIGGVTLSELWSGITRYKPVAVVVGALLIAAIVLPGAAVLTDDGFASSTPDTRAPLVTASDATGIGVASPDTTAPFADMAAAPGVSTLVDAAASNSLTFEASPSTSIGSPASASSPADSGSGATSSSRTTAPAPTGPTYTIREGGWATAGAANPLAGADVPAGGLPVGKRLGDVDKISFVRLSGVSNALVIKLSDAPGANRFADSAKIEACRILDGSWQAAPAMSFEKAPPIDRSSCTAGAVQEDGTWRFDLTGFTDAADARGFALVPAADAGTDFQLVFQPA